MTRSVVSRQNSSCHDTIPLVTTRSVVTRSIVSSLSWSRRGRIASRLVRPEANFFRCTRERLKTLSLKPTMALGTCAMVYHGDIPHPPVKANDALAVSLTPARSPPDARGPQAAQHQARHRLLPRGLRRLHLHGVRPPPPPTRDPRHRLPVVHSTQPGRENDVRSLSSWKTK
jgi:hypothetical protein